MPDENTNEAYETSHTRLTYHFHKTFGINVNGNAIVYQKWE